MSFLWMDLDAAEAGNRPREKTLVSSLWCERHLKRRLTLFRSCARSSDLEGHNAEYADGSRYREKDASSAGRHTQTVW